MSVVRLMSVRDKSEGIMVYAMCLFTSSTCRVELRSRGPDADTQECLIVIPIRSSVARKELSIPSSNLMAWHLGFCPKILKCGWYVKATKYFLLLYNVHSKLGIFLVLCHKCGTLFPSSSQRVYYMIAYTGETSFPSYESCKEGPNWCGHRSIFQRGTLLQYTTELISLINL